METPPWYVLALLYLMIVATMATLAAFFVGFILMFCEAWRKHMRGGNDEEEDGGSGGGGWTDKPGPPSGGGGGGDDPDRTLHEQFHAIADAIGKIIESEKKEKVGIK